MRKRSKSPRTGARRGSATVFMAVTVVGLGAMSLGLLAMNVSVEKEQATRQRALASFYAAEAGLSAGFQDMLNGGDGAVGSPNNPQEFGSSSFYVVPDVMSKWQTSLTAVGTANRNVSRAELVVLRIPNGIFQAAAFGDDAMVLQSNTFVDSFESDEGTYASQVDVATGFANANGDVGSNLDVTLMANTQVHGDATPGVTGSLLDDAPLTFVDGSTASLTTAMAMPPISVPTLPAAPAISTLAFDVLGAGHYHIPSIMVNMGDSLTLTGPSVIVVDDLELRSNSTLVIDATNGPVEIYGTGSFELKSNSNVVTQADSALDISVMLTGDNYGAGSDGSVITLASNSDFTGSIYAPNAKVLVSSNFEIFGAITADHLTMASYSRLHYDEMLAYEGPGSTIAFDTLLWRPLGEK